MAETHIYDDGVTMDELVGLAGIFDEETDMVKLVVDVATGRLAAGAGMHYEEEQALLDTGSRQEDLWGLNIYTAKSAGDPERIILESMINLRPGQGNRSRIVQVPEIEDAIMAVIESRVVGW